MKSATEKQLEGWEIGTDFEIVRILGSGSYGSVCEAIHKPSMKRVAIKKILNVFEDCIDCKRILREIHMLRKLSHPNVVKLYDILEPKDLKSFDSVYLVLEYAQSDLKKLVKSAIYLNKIHIQKLVYNILVGLQYTHSANVLHRDIKSANVLINEDCSVRICDFGLARSTTGISAPSMVMTSDKTEKSEVKKESQESPNHGKKIIKERLRKMKGLRWNMRRQLTGHVVTRWYRAPEIILLEKDYGAAVDMWAVGCIFAELLSMMKENVSTYSERKPLFPGKSCFPLSPDKKGELNKSGFPDTHSDQLNVIFDVIGTPSEDELLFVTDPKAVEYLMTFEYRKRVDFKEKFPAAGDDALDLLNKMLVFNPFFRITVEECLAHPFFSAVRDKSKERLAERGVELSFEREGELGEKRLRELYLDEINYYKAKRQEGKIVYQ